MQKAQRVIILALLFFSVVTAWQTVGESEVEIVRIQKAEIEAKLNETTAQLAEVSAQLAETNAQMERMKRWMPQIYGADLSRGEQRKLTMMVTAYTASPDECGKSRSHPDYGRTASGAIAKEGRTVAAGPGLPFGTLLYIEGLGYRVVEDRGGAISDERLDVYYDESNKQEALDLGRSMRTVWIVKLGG